MDIEQVIARAREGDVAAYGEVVLRFQGRLRTFIAVYCPAADQVDEIAQRAFVWAFEHLREYQPGTRFHSWLKQIARNILLAELEVQRRETRARRRYLEHLQVLQGQEELRNPGGADLAETLRECLEALPEHAREILRRRYEEHATIEDLARESGKGTSAVKVTLFRIRQALRRCTESKARTKPALSVS